MRFLKLIALIAMSLALFACGDHVIFGPTGTSTIIATGGDGATGAGGNGASIDIYSYGDVKIQSTGMVDTYFAVPSLNSNFGALPVEISSNTTVAFVNFSTTVNTTTNLPESGTLFVSVPSGAAPPFPDRNLYQSTGPSTPPNVVTGLKVNPGVTLAIPGNGWNYGPTQNNSLYIQLDNAIEINGTVVNTADNERLNIESAELLKIGPSGKVTTVSQTAGGTSSNIYLYSNGSAVNQGIIDASGPSGGGNAGWVEFEADNIIYNTGSLLSVGGDNAEGAGGMGIYADLYSYYGSIYSSGIINVSGGKGSTAGGGVDSGIAIYASESNDIGRLFVTGSLLANGGEGLAGAGGSAGYINILNIYSHGALRSTAKISAKGGAGSDGFDGGGGGTLIIEQAHASQGYGAKREMPSEPIQIYGNIDISGGKGGLNGGSAGYIRINNASNFARQNLKAISGVELYGFVSVKTAGGSGATTGGNGGYINIETTSAFYVDSDGELIAATPAGGILNEAAITTKGGNGVAGDGGNGGTISFYENGEYWTGASTAINRGSLDMTGGDGNNGGNGGDFWIDVHDDITNTGPVTSKGGKGLLAGGQGGEIEFDNTLNVTNSASIIVTGGAGATGGDANYVDLIAGEKLVNSGAIVCNGGAGDTADVGGAGGDIELFGGYGTTNSGSLNVTGGTGKIGTIVIDGSDVTPTSGIL